MITKHVKNFFYNAKQIIEYLDLSQISKLAKDLRKLRKKKGRLFFIGVGGSAGNCTHAVNDFRKLCNIESYCITDNVSELTARINDEGWDSSFSEWLKVSNLSNKDSLFVMSVGGGDLKKQVSVNIVNAIKYAKKQKAKVFGIVGRNGGYTKKRGDRVIVIPTVNKKLVTPFTEGFHGVIWHCLVSDPILQTKKTKW